MANASIVSQISREILESSKPISEIFELLKLLVSKPILNM